MENTNEAAPVVAGAAKVVAGMAKAGAKAASAVAKGGAKAAKATGSAAKGAAKSTKFKRPNIRSYKNPETGKVDMDRYRSDQAKYKKIQQDKKNRPDMSNVKPDEPSDDRTKRGERKLNAIDKVTNKKKEGIKQGLQTTGNVAKSTGQVIKKTGNVATKAVSAVSGGFGTSSFRKESKITFKDYLNKL